MFEVVFSRAVSIEAWGSCQVSPYSHKQSQLPYLVQQRLLLQITDELRYVESAGWEAWNSVILKTR